MQDDFSEEQIETARKLFSGTCDFMLGVTDLRQLPDTDVSEVAFAGRSNVGKSSLLNALTGRKDLARTSNTPGRTQQLNFFNLGDALYMVDMPGYGYAKVSKQQRSEWDRLIFDYLRGRPNLRCVFVLIDSRHGLKDSDEHLMKMLDQAAVPYRVILTKADKGKGLETMRQKVAEKLAKHPAAWPSALSTSAWKNEGFEVLRAVITSLR